MNKKSLLFVFSMLAVALVSSCSSSKKTLTEKQGGLDSEVSVRMEDNLEMDNNYLVLSDAQRDIVRRNNVFALNLFNKVSDFDSKVISPLSVSYLMGMLANGADGNTRREILRTIGCEGVSVNELNELFHGILNVAGKVDPQTKVNISNYVAVNSQLEINRKFAQTVSSHYQAGVESLDFSSPRTTDHINNWCREHTDGMIPYIINKVEPSAVSYLMNAIYFNGTWQHKFSESRTRPENFHGTTKDIQKVDMMNQTGKFMYLENSECQAIRLPYGNGTYVMTVLLPREGKSIGEMMTTLNADKISNLSHEMEQCQVTLKLPKFTTEMSLPLNNLISQLGAPSIFHASTADFRNFAKGGFFVSAMLQKAKIEVSEQGTKAAAVTAAIMLTSAGPSQQIRRVNFFANRPFVYMITDTQSDAILFMGLYTGGQE